MPAPLMPKATAVWLVENTSLTFEQIADFCESASARNPGDRGRRGGQPDARPRPGGQRPDHRRRNRALPSGSRVRGSNSRRRRCRRRFISTRDRATRQSPSARTSPTRSAYLLKTYPELSDAQISKLIGTTKPTIAAVRDRTHWNSPNIKPRHPVGLGLCTLEELEEAVDRSSARCRSTRRLAAKESGGSKRDRGQINIRRGARHIPRARERRRSRRGRRGRRSSPASGSPRRRRSCASCRAISCPSGSSAGRRRQAPS